MLNKLSIERSNFLNQSINTKNNASRPVVAVKPMIKLSKYAHKPFEKPGLTFTQNFVQPIKYFKSSHSVSKSGLLNVTKPIAQVPPYKQLSSKNEEFSVKNNEPDNLNGKTDDSVTLSVQTKG